MDNVIFVDFKKPCVIDQDFSALDDYIRYLGSEGLDEDDLIEVQEAIQNADIYLEADPVVKDFADFWFSNSN